MERQFGRGVASERLPSTFGLFETEDLQKQAATHLAIAILQRKSTGKGNQFQC
jgi:hypothetical protein